MHYAPERWCGAKVMIDTNAINARQANDALNQIETWRASGVILHLMSEPAFAEAMSGRNDARIAKAGKQVRGISHHGADEQRLWLAIERAIFPRGAQTDAQRNDVEIVFQAHAWGYVLVTTDGESRRQPRGILGSRHELAELGVTVMRPEEFVAVTRVRIAARDERIERICALKGVPVPSWLGQD
jgi:hypothetical protein